MFRHSLFLLVLAGLLVVTPCLAQGGYDHFRVSIYTRALVVQQMEDTHWLDSTWQVISSQLEVDKIYLETYRDQHLVDKNTLRNAISFFAEKGVEVAGGITYTIAESNYFQTFCYSTPEKRERAKEIISFTASHFDEVILDDFFFTSCKCERCVAAKGKEGWAEYRLELMTNASKNIIVGPARAANPDVKVVIKYPNWYDHFHELGFNLETQPAIFDGLYTGTETRDAKNSDQHLQPYNGYLVFRYLENLKPGKNGGGWVDTYGSRTFDRYAEQLWLTILAKAPEMTLFDYTQMLMPLRSNLIAPWSYQETSFGYGSFLPLPEKGTMAAVVAHALSVVDHIAGELGEPVGIKSYKPFHSDGEDFLQNYLGMIGIPIDLVKEFPMEGEMIILTEQAAKDPEIVQKIHDRLMAGKDVMITSGLLHALHDRGIREMVNLQYTSRKSMVTGFSIRMRSVEGKEPMLIPQVSYFTNDSWEVISAMDGELGWPFLHRGDYGNADLYMLVIPENFSDLYNLPPEVLNRIREIAAGSMDITLQGPSKVALFPYDNNRIVVESFNDEPVEIHLLMERKPVSVTDLETGAEVEIRIIPEMRFWGRVFNPEKYAIDLTLPPHTFRAFKFE